MKNPIALIIAASCALNASAQKSAIPTHELSYSMGILSIDQLIGLSESEMLGPYMSFPNAISFATFFSYRKYLSRHFALGATIGIDDQSGALTYGDEHHGNFHGGLMGTAGHYSRQASTVAIEAFVAYERHANYTIGGYVGAGYTYATSTYSFNSGVDYRGFFEHQSTPVKATNPYTYHREVYGFQITPVAFRYGGRVAGTFEIGFGYKGIFSGGFSVRL